MGVGTRSYVKSGTCYSFFAASSQLSVIVSVFIKTTEFRIQPSYYIIKFRGGNFQLIDHVISLLFRNDSKSTTYIPKIVPKYGSEEKGSSLCKCSILLGFFMSKKLERLRSELLSEDKITNLLGFLTK